MSSRLQRAFPALLALVVLAAPGPVLGAPEDEPDLVPELPAFPYAGQVAPVFIDRFAQPGKLLYRFDAILRNHGGTLDLFHEVADGRAQQAIWSGGLPTADPRPDQAPPDNDDVVVLDRTPNGASFDYVVEPDHAHWHFFDAARYELLVPGGAARVSQKIGFCLFDSFDLDEGSNYFPPWERWCGRRPTELFVRMGLSPGAGDRYRSQLHLQWVDMSNLAPGRYTLRATANPVGVVKESDRANNVVEQGRTVPGTTGADVYAQVFGVPTAIPLEGAVVGASIPARRDADCLPGPSSHDCYVWATENGPLTFRVVRQPAGGRVELGAADGNRASATYTQNPGFSGRDSFAYSVTDARGLESAPATVSLDVGPQRPVARPRALVSSSVVRRRGESWRAVLRLRSAGRISGRLVRASRTVRLLRARRVRAGRRTLPLGSLERGSYRLRLRVSAGGRSQLVTLRFSERR